MKAEYEAWITAYVAKCGGLVRGKCAVATEAMIKEFPELRRCAGFVHVSWGRSQHWWAATPEGEIIDPTAIQFAPIIFSYEELDLTDPATREKVPTGRCLDCGDDVYSGSTFCGPECETSTREYLGF